LFFKKGLVLPVRINRYHGYFLMNDAIIRCSENRSSGDGSGAIQTLSHVFADTFASLRLHPLLSDDDVLASPHLIIVPDGGNTRHNEFLLKKNVN
jgi:hypothetical protein